MHYFSVVSAQILENAYSVFAVNSSEVLWVCRVKLGIAHC